MALIGVTKTGNTWPGTLEVSRLDAYAGAFKIDPDLPVIGTDPKYQASKVVIGRGRLVGINADAAGQATAITTAVPHTSILTVADGINVAPLGYATANVIKDWDSKTNGVMAAINRNMAIAVPYLPGINGLYGTLKQGQKVTALYSTDPRKIGAIAKFIPMTVGSVRGTAGANLPLSGFLGFTPSVQTGFRPTIVAAYNAAGAYLSGAAVSGSVVYASTNGWAVSAANVSDAIFSYGQTPDMIAGEVMEMEGLSDMPGFLKWVTSNFGEWSLGYDLAYPLVGNSSSTAATSGVYLSAGVICLAKTASNTISPVRMDANKAIVITTNATTSAFIFNTSTGAWDDKGVSYILPQANFEGADYTQGAYYMVDPISGTIRLFGVAADSSGTSFGSTAAAGDAAPFKVDYYLMPMQEQPAYGTGIYGLNDGTNFGTPLEWTRDPVTLATSVGIMKVAIH